MSTATTDRPAVTLTVDIRTTRAVVEHHDSTAPADRLHSPLVADIRGDGNTAHQVRRVPTVTSRLVGHVDGVLVTALLAPPALIAFLMALGVQFALAVCVMFAVVFVATTSEDAMWMWRHHTDRQSNGNPD